MIQPPGRPERGELVGVENPTAPRDPGTEAAARRLVERLGPVPYVPVVVPLRRGVALLGDPGRGRALARAVLARLVALHAPDDVRVARGARRAHGNRPAGARRPRGGRPRLLHRCAVLEAFQALEASDW